MKAGIPASISLVVHKFFLLTSLVACQAPQSSSRAFSKDAPPLETAISPEEAESWFQALTGQASSEVGKKLSLVVGLGDAQDKCFPEEQLENLCALPFAEVESFDVYRDGCEKPQKLTEASFRTIGRCLPGLRMLDFDGNNASDLSGIGDHLPNLVQLKLLGNPALATADLNPISSLSKLTSLYLEGKKLSDESLKSLESPSLEYLVVELDEEAQWSADFKRRLPALKFLNLSDTSLSRESQQAMFLNEELRGIHFSQDYLLITQLPAYSAEDIAWLQAEAAGMFVNIHVSEEQLLAALQNNRNLKVLYLRRPITEKEALAILRTPLRALQVGSHWTLIDSVSAAARQLGPEIQVEAVNYSYTEVVVSDPDGTFDSREDIKAAFQGSRTKLQTFWLKRLSARLSRWVTHVPVETFKE